jgi:hypothetical protein
MRNLEILELMKGKTLINSSISENMEELVFTFSDGFIIKMYHQQDCCEDVHIESIIGELTDLYHNPLLHAIEIQDERNLDYGEHSTYTFYKFATIKGWVDIRWVGSSNGYYSEEVDFEIIQKAEKENICLK